jgi:hypothetical protein
MDAIRYVIIGMLDKKTQQHRDTKDERSAGAVVWRRSILLITSSPLYFTRNLM